MGRPPITLVALVLIAACQESATDPAAAGPTVSNVLAVGPTAEACLSADAIVSDWSELQAALQTANQVTAITGTIEVPDGVVENVVGVTLTCAYPGAALALSGSLTLSGGPITLEGVTFLGGPGSFRISAWPGTPIRVARSRFVAHGSGSQLIVDNADAPAIVENAFLAPSGVGGIQLWVSNASGPRILGNTFSTVGYSIAQLILHQTTDVEVRDNRFYSSEATLFSAIHVQAYGPWSGRSTGRIAGNFIETQAPSSAGVSRGYGIGVTSGSKAAGLVVTDNFVLGPWAVSLGVGGGDGHWTGNAIDGADLTADVYLPVASCNNLVRVRLARPADGFSRYGPQVAVIDLGTENTILGAASIKRGTEVAPPFRDLDAFCPPGQVCTP
jgi:hypothetical protein